MATARHVPLLVVLASATVGVSACDETAEDGDQLAVGAVDGDVTAYFRLCDGERPISLRFFELDGDQVAGDGGDVLLTEIGDLTGSNLDAGVVVGSYDDLSPGKAYFVEMNTSRQTAGDRTQASTAPSAQGHTADREAGLRHPISIDRDVGQHATALRDAARPVDDRGTAVVVGVLGRPELLHSLGLDEPGWQSGKAFVAEDLPPAPRSVSLRSAPVLVGQMLDGWATGAGLAAIGGVEVIAAALGWLALGRIPSVGELELEEHDW